MMCINGRFTSRLLPPQAIIKPMSQAACWVDWHRKKDHPNFCGSVQQSSSNWSCSSFYRVKTLKRRTTKKGEAAGNKVRQRHHPSQLLRRQQCTLTEVPSVQVIWSVGNVAPVTFLSYPLTLSTPCLELYTSFFLFPVADPWATILSLRT